MPTNDRAGRPRHPDRLTPAEWTTVEGVRHGLSNPAIAARLGVSVDAVKFHVSNALGKLGLASRAELRLWTGVRMDSRMHADGAASAGDVAILGLGQVSRRTRDVAAMTRWLVDVVGLRHLYSFGELAFFDLGGARLFLSKGDPAGDATLYFRVADIQAAHAALVDRGATAVAAPHRIHRHDDGSEEWMSFFGDPDGGTLALMAVVGVGDTNAAE